VEPYEEEEALFRRFEGWTGGDGVFSVSLDDDRILWLFGDTFIGTVVQGRHRNADLVHNTLAVQKGKDPFTAEIRFFWGRQDDKNTAFFLPPDGRGWFWPYHGIRVRAGLFLFLIQVERSPGPVGFDFQVIGAWLARVKNPEQSPEEWKMDFYRIPFSHGQRIFGSAVLEEKDSLLIFGVEDRRTAGLPEKVILLARVPADKPADFAEWTFFSQAGWVKTVDKAEAVCRSAANEFSVSYQPALRRYIMVYTEDSLSEHMVYRLAERPQGPWSEPVRFHRCPEARWEPRVFCYAAKGHPVLSRSAAELVFSYTTNSTDFELIENDARYYRPRFLRLLFKKAWN
jgi:hypothetical protein